MYINVTLFGGLREPLTYRIPDSLLDQITIGSLVRVPVRNSTRAALVVSLVQKPRVSYEIKDIQGLEPVPNDAHFAPYLKKLAAYYRVDYTRFIWRMKQFLALKQSAKDLPTISPPPTTFNLTPEQQKIVDSISPTLTANQFAPQVIHGVTGSGKTMVYRALIEQALGQGKNAVLLLPEVMMAVAFEHTFKQWFSAEQVIGFHSASSVKEKKRLWQAMIQQKPTLIIGVHLPMLLPTPKYPALGWSSRQRSAAISSARQCYLNRLAQSAPAGTVFAAWLPPAVCQYLYLIGWYFYRNCSSPAQLGRTRNSDSEGRRVRALISVHADSTKSSLLLSLSKDRRECDIGPICR